jgi:antitoxin (DNA-binding transcriptional repressor) of toxin-antitoxin stability system
MESVTTHYAKTHLSRLLKRVQRGESIVILSGRVPVGCLTAPTAPSRQRPRTGTVTSGPVRYADDAFAPLDDNTLREWGL